MGRAHRQVARTCQHNFKGRNVTESNLYRFWVGMVTDGGMRHTQSREKSCRADTHEVEDAVAGVQAKRVARVGLMRPSAGVNVAIDIADKIKIYR